MKNFFLFIVFLFLFSSLHAQIFDEKPLRLSIGASAGLPMSSSTNYYNLAYGIDGQAEYSVGTAIALTLDGSYGSFTKKSGVTINNLKLASALVGAKYYLSNNFYGGVHTGVSLKASSGTGSTFILAPEIGINLAKSIDFSVRYQAQLERGFNYSYVGIRVGLTFFSM